MPILDRVTITGADNSIEPVTLVSLSQAYPFVEWGILVSASNEGAPRYPTRDWRDQLATIFDGPLSLAVHVQGRWLRELLAGDQRFLVAGAGVYLMARAQRVQLNFHGDKLKYDVDKFSTALTKVHGSKQFIFQHDNCLGEDLMREVIDKHDHHDAVAFFDTSHGAGVLPEKWPDPYWMHKDGSYRYHGYAGGLGPDNLAEQIPLIAKAKKNGRFWIDMETKVRTGEKFDLTKVRRALEICEPFVGVELPA